MWFSSEIVAASPGRTHKNAANRSPNSHDLFFGQHLVENVVSVHRFENHSELLPLEVHGEALGAWLDLRRDVDEVIRRICSHPGTAKPPSRPLFFSSTAHTHQTWVRWTKLTGWKQFVE